MELINIKEKIDYEKIKKCSNSIKNGNLVIFPTETVYGIGANSFDSNAVSKIFKAKGRPGDNPLIVHISDMNMLNQVATGITDIEKQLIERFWPGPLTIILPKNNSIPNNVTCNLDTVGVRMPENEIARLLIKEAGVPIAAPSANISGKPSGTIVDDIVKEIGNNVEYIIDGGTSDIGVESTVVKVIGDVVNILRPGKISPEDIQKLGVKVKLDSHIFNKASKEEKVESPGMKHRHYAPNVKAVLVYSNNENDLIDKVKNIINNETKKKICIIGYNEHKKILDDNVDFIEYGSKENMEEISHNLFNVLRRVDNGNYEICIIEGVKKEGIGIAIMNRLIRACGYNYIEV